MKTLNQLTTAYIEKLEADGKSKPTLYTYRKDLDIVETFFTKEKEISQIMIPQVGKFLKSNTLLKKPNGSDKAPRTIEKTVRVFRMMLFWAKEKGFIESVPLPKSTPLGASIPKEKKKAKLQKKTVNAEQASPEND